MPQTHKAFPELAVLKDSEFALSLLVEATQQDLGTVKQRLQREEASIGTNVLDALQQWGIPPSKWDNRLEAFYEKTDAFLFETLTWNRTPQKQGLREWIAGFLAKDQKPGARVLTFGDGLGFDALYLARCGYDVTYYEKSQVCARFCAQMAKREEVGVSHIADAGKISHGTYDVATCLDVLEHVPNPPQLVAQLAGYLKPGGRLIVHAPFWMVHESAATHLSENRKYGGRLDFYSCNGLRLIEGNARWSPLVFEKLAPGLPKTPISCRTRMELAIGWVVFSVARYWSWPLFRLSGMK